MIEFENADVVRVPGCPHYVTSTYYAQMVAMFGESAAGTVRCEGCLVNGRPGVERRVRPSLRRDGLNSPLERQRYLYGRVA